MQHPIKRLGEMLVEAGLITPAQLQSAITHQKIARGRLGSNLVALGYITEEVLMDFLSHQTGVPRMDVRTAEVPPEILKLIPHRLAEQFTVLPVAIKEPKSLVLAMSDPSDLNAIDSARFASGLHIEPVVASHSALRKAIADLYRRLDTPTPSALTIELGAEPLPDDALPMPFAIEPLPVPLPVPIPAPPPARPAAFPPDPFFDSPGMPTQPIHIDPFGFFDPAPAKPAAPAANPDLIHSRTLGEVTRRLETYHTRALVMGLIRLFQRRGIIGQDELQRLLANLI
ncbi:MAG TPA: hypothetical protein VF804_01255, partial [Holophagaceae bacterium]